ncbi:hypothetical protein KGF57_002763 [Candida theae]|uniref:Uncharacterized protein n=1 Tax=Candida theae TaxID=1198502 RepID=A0AAD5BE85_9ASCO|nr:uncharacterized protein KGF57_002763 [Candida theae]KAI5957955.1 hypothetical protein KGF57_002763 [Candida theae]
MSDEKEKLKQKYALEEQQAAAAQQGSSSHNNNNNIPDAPPAYDDIQGPNDQFAPPPDTPSYSQHPPPPPPPQQQQQQQDHYANYAPPQQGGGLSSQQQPHPQNLYTIKPNVVNINNTDPQNVNPQYPIFQSNQQAKVARGEYAAWNPKAPLEKGHTSNKRVDSSFPGSSGATYYNAANKH